MNGNAALMMQAMFWILLVLVVIAPLRLSIPLYLILVQFDVGGLGNYSIGSLGFENAIKAIVIPAVLFVRIRPIDSLPPAARALCRSWMFLICYAALATSWSPFPLSGLKMVGYLYSYAVMFLVLNAGWQRGWLTDRSIIAVIAVTLALAVLQTYILGNPYGDPQYDNRFTSFVGAATFCPFLLSLLILLVFRGELTLSKSVAVLASLAGLLLAGGRSIFMGFSWAVIVAGLAHAQRTRASIRFGRALKTAALSISLVVCVIVLVQWLLPDNRLNELFTNSLSGDSDVRDVATFAWRLNIYENILAELQHRGLSKLLIGSGTSSGVTVSLDNHIAEEDIADPNRSLHDEFLRSIYEWGVPGLSAVVVFIFASLRLGWRSAKLGHWQGWAFLAIWVPVLFSFLVENILSDGASPGGTGYTLILASMVASLSQYSGIQTNSLRTEAFKEA